MDMGGLEDAEAADGPICDKETSSFEVSSISCSICLDAVTNNGDRSRAKLQCGHEFHLDCIGSAINMKGAMQCPNCRKVERGRWLYASGSMRSFPEFSMDDWIPDEDSYELSYSEMPFRVHWCPVNGLARFHSSYEEMESPSTTYHNLHRNHAIYAEQTAGSSVPHSYVAYFGPIPPASSNTSESVEDPNSSRWNGMSGHNEIFTAHAFPIIDIQYQNWSHHSHPFPTNTGHVNSIDQASVPPATVRPTRGEYDALTRFGSFVHPFLYDHGYAARGGGSFLSSLAHPSSNNQSHERVQTSHSVARRQQLANATGISSPTIPGVRRFSGPRSLPQTVPAATQSNHSSGFFVFPPPGSAGWTVRETESPLQRQIRAWERDRSSHLPIVSLDREPGWSSLHHAASGSNPSSRFSGLWHRRWS